MMDEDFSGNKVNTAAPSNDLESDGNARRGDYFLVGFIGLLLAGLAGYLVLNPDESMLKRGTAIKNVHSEKAVAERITTKVSVHESTKPEPVTSKSITSKQVAPEPVAPEPVASKPEVSKPEVSKPEVSKPEVSEPEVSKPEVSEPEVSEPEVPEPEVSEPEVSEPKVSESAAAEPAMSEPVAPSLDIHHENKPQTDSVVWAVNLVSFSRLASAKKAMLQLKSEGVETEFIQITANGRIYYRVRIPDLGSRQEAMKLRAAFKSRPEYEGVWIASYRK